MKMSVPCKNDKQARFKQFLQRLSEDKDVGRGAVKPTHSLSELLLFAGYNPNGEAIDMARLVTLLLRTQGLEGCSEQMVEHVLNGGSIEGFFLTNECKS
jgi:hypothetical protein